MKNKKTIATISLALSVFLLASYTVIKTSGAHPGSTGAPGDKTCAQKGCHEDASVVLDPIGINTLAFSSVDTSYLPGQTYTINLQVQNPGTTKFGFELVALRDADTTDIGQFTLIDAVRTQLINSIAPNGVRNSVTHQTAGTPGLSPGATQWSFKWTAPATNAGPITFYYATNCTNNDGTNSGDQIFLSSFKVKVNGAIYLKEQSSENDLKAYYDSERKEINVSYKIPGSKKVQILTYNVTGQVISKTQVSEVSGKQKTKISVPADLAKGTYVIELIVDEKTKTNKKIIIY